MPGGKENVQNTANGAHGDGLAGVVSRLEASLAEESEKRLQMEQRIVEQDDSIDQLVNLCNDMYTRQEELAQRVAPTRDSSGLNLSIRPLGEQSVTMNGDLASELASVVDDLRVDLTARVSGLEARTKEESGNARQALAVLEAKLGDGTATDSVINELRQLFAKQDEELAQLVSKVAAIEFGQTEGYVERQAGGAGHVPPEHGAVHRKQMQTLSVGARGAVSKPALRSPRQPRGVDWTREDMAARQIQFAYRAYRGYLER
jgi:hypothetical protein